MKTQSSLIRSNGAIHFNTKTTVDVNIPPVVDPRNTKNNNPLRNNHSFQYFFLNETWIFHHIIGKRFNNPLNSLVKLRLPRIFLLQVNHKIFSKFFWFFEIHYSKFLIIHGGLKKKLNPPGVF